MQANLKILIADNSLASRMLISAMLTQEIGVDPQFISEARDGQEAIYIAANETFDLIIMDVYMPNLSGLNAIKELRQKGSNTPILVITSETSPERLNELKEAGANGLIIKPVEPGSFKSAISHVVASKIQ